MPLHDIIICADMQTDRAQLLAPNNDARTNIKWASVHMRPLDLQVALLLPNYKKKGS